ncbi:MLX-interacting protein-like isoform X2 [Biomphalaria pfeifferi]|uniref:MLX-interacting protein-like isoform X2 n=1 Tax=Biomphalaria pfeifferi TaxID=112525 RepID=A0AAD8F1Y6_BIOPF|nr:MLX-interacting protein-like isoform X2 [Biomphalaria pfeifferi]
MTFASPVCCLIYEGNFLLKEEDRLPSLSCDLGDISISSSEIDQFFQSFSEFSLPPDASQMQVETEGSHLSTLTSCDLTSFFFEDLQRPRDLNVENPVQAQFYHNLNPSFVSEDEATMTPTYPGGITPQNISRANSPTWSESSGSMSTSSVPGTPTGTQSQSSKNSNNPLPRHKRPSHKRAEIKRRDKIKTCLDDIKDCIPSLRDKGKLSESAILSKAAEYVRHLKDGCTQRGNKAEELRREIECLSTEIHSFQENLPATGLNDEPLPATSLDDLYLQWREENSQRSAKFCIFASITSKLFDTFKEIIGPVTTLNALTATAQEWQTKFLALPVLRKVILGGMLELSRQDSIVMTPDKLQLQVGASNARVKMEDTFS